MRFISRMSSRRRKVLEGRGVESEDSLSERSPPICSSLLRRASAEARPAARARVRLNEPDVAGRLRIRRSPV
jgi:hypothetical protein